MTYNAFSNTKGDGEFYFHSAASGTGHIEDNPYFFVRPTHSNWYYRPTASYGQTYPQAVYDQTYAQAVYEQANAQACTQTPLATVATQAPVVDATAPAPAASKKRVAWQPDDKHRMTDDGIDEKYCTNCRQHRLLEGWPRNKETMNLAIVDYFCGDDVLDLLPKGCAHCTAGFQRRNVGYKAVKQAGKQAGKQARKQAGKQKKQKKAKSS